MLFRLATLVMMGSFSVSACALPFTTPAKKSSGVTTAWHDISLKVPSSIAGYSVKAELDGAKGLRSGGAESLLDGGMLYSFRRGVATATVPARLYATLEVGEIKTAANAGDSTFQQNVVAQIGTSVMRAVQVKGRTVYEGTGNRQLVFVWFKGRLMHVLLTHDIKDTTSLLEETLALP
ncbi:MAG: hypothetical protein ACYDGR_14660 [Candidatus Dormibacteria bacterium]